MSEEENVKTECILGCYYDKELKCCGSCFRTLEEIADTGKRKKHGKRDKSKQRESVGDMEQ